MTGNPQFLFINKTSKSEHLSQSAGVERSSIYRHVQHGKHAQLPSFVTDPTFHIDIAVPIEEVEQQQQLWSSPSRARTSTCCHRPRGDQESYKNTSIKRCISSKQVIGTQLVATFVNRSIFAVRHEVDIHQLNPFMWTTILPSVLGIWPVVDESVRALSFAVIGRQDRNLALQATGWNSYGLSLQGICRALDHGARSFSDEIVCACLVVLSFQHLGSDASQRDQAAHFAGLAQIIQLRGPQSFVLEFAHKLFLIARSKLIHQALLEQRKTFMAMQLWCRVPWQVHTKNHIDSLMDHIAQLPELYEINSKIQLMTSSCERAKARAILIHRCKIISRDVERWFALLPPRIRGTEADARALGLDEKGNGLPTREGTIYLGNSMMTVILLSKYWACLIELTVLMTSAVGTPTTHFHVPGQEFNCRATLSTRTNSSRDGSSNLERNEDLFALAKPICVLAEFCLSLERRQVAKQYVYFALRAAKKAYERQSPRSEQELSWCNDLIKKAEG